MQIMYTNQKMQGLVIEKAITIVLYRRQGLIIIHKKNILRK